MQVEGVFFPLHFFNMNANIGTNANDLLKLYNWFCKCCKKKYCNSLFMCISANDGQDGTELR